MGKRQIRIFRNNILLKRSEIEGNFGHVILANHVVHNGQILEITEHQVVLLNPRRQKQTFDLAAILEVVFDKETDY